MIWTPQVMNRMLELRAGEQPPTFERVAEILNAEFDLRLTKNACIGRMHAYQRRGLFKRRVQVDAPIPPQAPVRHQHESRLTIYQLRTEDCRWPVTEGRAPFLYCGHPIAERGMPYCLKHSRRAYNRWPPAV